MESKWADAIEACIRDTCLDLTGLDGDAIAVLRKLPPAGWKALNDLAGIPGLASVALPAAVVTQPEALGEIGAGLKVLPGLVRLDVHVPGGKLRLNLAPVCGKSVQHVEVHLPPARGRVDHSGVQLDITVPAAVDRVEASGAAAPSLSKSIVRYVSGEGGEEPEECHTLPGAPYERKPTDFAPTDTETPSQAAIHNRNADVKFQGSEDKAACRHLATQWLHKREAYHRGKGRSVSADDVGSSTDSKQGKRFSFEGLMTDKEISRLDRKALEGSRDKVLSGKADKVDFEVARFGDAVHSAFGKMKRNDVRLYGLSLGDHYMALELRVRTTMRNGKPVDQYVATLYDPNKTASHVRLVESDLEKFKGRPLDVWVGSNLATQYTEGKPGTFSSGALGGTLYGHPPPSQEREAAWQHEQRAKAGEDYRKALEKTPQHDLVGQAVELREGDGALNMACAAQNLKAVFSTKGKGDDDDEERLACVARNDKGLESLGKFRIDIHGLKRQHSMPEAVGKYAQAEGSVYYLVPASQMKKAQTAGTVTSKL